jgi:hypothetical protein
VGGIFEDEIIEFADHKSTAGKDVTVALTTLDPDEAVHTAVLAEKERKAPIIGKRIRRSRKPKPDITVDQVLEWADRHNERTGAWPGCRFGEVHGVPDETWFSIDCILRKGGRGLGDPSSLANLLERERGVRNYRAQPHLTYDSILAWADSYHEQNGGWPGCKMGVVEACTNETWSGIENALRKGTRGLPGRTSLAALLRERRRGSCTKQRAPSVGSIGAVCPI